MNGLTDMARPTSTIKTARLAPDAVLLGLFVLSLPFFPVWQGEGLVRPDWIVGGVLILLFFLRVALRQRMILTHVAPWVVLLNLAALMSSINLWSSNASQVQVYEFSTVWLQLVNASLLFFAISNARVSRLRLLSILRLWVAAACLVAIYGIYQAFARNLGWPLAYVPLLNPRPSPSHLSWGLGFGGYIRPSSILREPSYLGEYLLGPLLLTMYGLFYGKDRGLLFKSGLVNRMIFVVLMTAFVLAFSLSAYWTFAVVLFVGIWDRRVRTSTARAIVVVLLLVIVGALIGQTAGGFLFGVSERSGRILALAIGCEATPGRVDSSTLTRLTEAAVALQLWSSSPLIGVGLNSVEFAAVGAGLDVPEWFIRQGFLDRGYVHSMWLQALAEMGAIGFLALLGVYWSALNMMLSTFRRSNCVMRTLAVAFFYILLADATTGVMGGTYFRTAYWFDLGMASLVHSADTVGQRER